MNGQSSTELELLPITKSFYQNLFAGITYLRPHQSLGYRTPAEVLDISPYGYVDKANALTHIPTRTTTITDVKDSLIL
jgi:hypothetical protein